MVDEILYQYHVNNGIIVKDDIETGHGSVIPLWYFGMNY